MDTNAELIRQIELSLKVRGITIPFAEDEKSAILGYELDKAYNAINRTRGYVATTEKPVEPQFNDLAVRLVVYSVSKWGAEGQFSHGESGVSRSYESANEYPPSLMREIVPLAKSIKFR